jgi:hypothetical protein
MRSHSIDERLDELTKTLILLQSGYEVQIIVGVKKFADLLQTNKEQCIKKLLPNFIVTFFF